MSAPPVPRIAVVAERYGDTLSPCASIRLHAPFDALRRTRLADVRFVLGAEVEATRPDVIVWHRVALRDAAAIERMVGVAHRTGARMVFDLDDHLLGMDEHSERDAYAPMVAAVRASLAVAHRVWCSTERLASLVAPAATGSLAVMPNVLDPDVWELDQRGVVDPGLADAPLRILYMGTRTHDEDYAFLAGVMGELHAQAPGMFELHRIGVRSTDADAAPWLRIHGIAGHVGASYPAFVHWLVRQPSWDVGVAPLMDTAFNAGKSPIKVLDYAALGIASVASRVPAYSELVDGVECVHADNTLDAWCAALQSLAADRGALVRLRDAARLRVTRSAFEQGCMRRMDDINALLG